MPKRALMDKRPYLLASIAAALAYYILRDGQLGDIYLVGFKGAACGLLAVYAWHRSHTRDVHLIAAVMAISAVADMVIEFYFRQGALIFFAAHLVALTLYLQPHNRRKRLTPSQKGAVVVLLVLTPIIALLLSHDAGAAIYGVSLGGMAAGAWASRFSRYHVGIGALLFVASDMLIFARLGGAGLMDLPHWLIWPTYYVGQFLICTGVVQTIKRDHQA